MRLLIDECLHTSLVDIASAHGHEAHHVAWLGRAGAKDWELMTSVRAGDFVFVTNNAKDFLRLFKREVVHNGLILLVPNVRPGDQRALFERVLETISAAPDLVNRVIEAAFEGEEIIIEIYGLPNG